MAPPIPTASPWVAPAVTKHTATVIFAHGMGQTPDDWTEAVKQWQHAGKVDEIKFILPYAPVMPVTISGKEMTAWFDMVTVKHTADVLQAAVVDEDDSGILQCSAYFHELIQNELSLGITGDRIVIGGYSQGGSVTTFAGLTTPVNLGGIFGLSCWLPLNESFEKHVPGGELNKKTPILLGHKEKDPQIKYVMAQGSEQVLRASGYNVTLETFT